MCGVDSVKSLSARESVLPVLDFKYQIAHLALKRYTGIKYIHVYT
jgi:hypothetical protein